MPTRTCRGTDPPRGGPCSIETCGRACRCLFRFDLVVGMQAGSVQEMKTPRLMYRSPSESASRHLELKGWQLATLEGV